METQLFLCWVFVSFEPPAFPEPCGAGGGMSMSLRFAGEVLKLLVSIVLAASSAHFADEPGI